MANRLDSMFYRNIICMSILDRAGLYELSPALWPGTGPDKGIYQLPIINWCLVLDRLRNVKLNIGVFNSVRTNVLRNM